MIRQHRFPLMQQGSARLCCLTLHNCLTNLYRKKIKPQILCENGFPNKVIATKPVWMTAFTHSRNLDYSKYL